MRKAVILKFFMPPDFGGTIHEVHVVVARGIKPQRCRCQAAQQISPLGNSITRRSHSTRKVKRCRSLCFMLAWLPNIGIARLCQPCSPSAGTAWSRTPLPQRNNTVIPVARYPTVRECDKRDNYTALIRYCGVAVRRRSKAFDDHAQL